MRSLVLNQDYTPISICKSNRAFLMVFMKKVEMVSAFESSYLHTVDTSYPMPAVIRLHNYVNVPYKGVELSRQNVFKRDGHRCSYCGIGKNLTLDHVTAKSKGGKSTWNNLATACQDCNSKKGDADLADLEMQLAIKPFKPSYLMFIKSFSGYAHDEWMPFLNGMVSKAG